MRRIRALVLGGALAGVPVLALGLAGPSAATGLGAGAVTDHIAGSPSSDGTAASADDLLVPGGPSVQSGGPPPQSVIPSGSIPASRIAPSNAQVATLNWAGYVETASSNSSVTGSWNEPVVSCSGSKHKYSSFWVGLDGWSSNTVEQIGTDSDCAGSKGVYYAWYEMYPGPSENLNPKLYPVSANDTLTGTVSGTGKTFTLTLVDQGKWQYKIVVSLTSAPARSSAEWIAEAPSLCSTDGCRITHLADFSSLTFSNAEADGQAISAFPQSEVDQIDMVGKVGIKASTSALTAAGTGFTVTWVHD